MSLFLSWTDTLCVSTYQCLPPRDGRIGVSGRDHGTVGGSVPVTAVPRAAGRVTRRRPTSAGTPGQPAEFSFFVSPVVSPVTTTSCTLRFGRTDKRAHCGRGLLRTREALASQTVVFIRHITKYRMFRKRYSCRVLGFVGTLLPCNSAINVKHLRSKPGDSVNVVFRS